MHLGVTKIAAARRVLLGLWGLALLAGCTGLPDLRQNDVRSVIEAGETQVALLAVQPWKKASEQLAPKFELDGAGALAAAIPRTGALEEKLLRAFTGELQVAPPTTSVTSTRTVTNDSTAETPTTDIGSRTLARGDGQLPGTPAAAGATRTASSQPGLPQDAAKTALAGDDPLLRYQTAAAIKQYVEILNSLLANTPKIDDYEPFLVTLQVSSFPYARHQPYDVYVDMSFFSRFEDGRAAPEIPAEASGAFSAAAAQPVIYPVLVTDNLEGRSASRSAELVRQLGFAAKILQGGFAAGLGLSSLNERATAVFGTDLTSTFTIGKTAENALTAVLGAPRNPISDYAMVRRTHNVSLLVLVPKGNASAKTVMQGAAGAGGDLRPLRALDLYSTTELRRPDQVGEPLPLVHDQAAYNAQVLETLRARGVLGQCPAWSDAQTLKFAGTLFGHVSQADFGRFMIAVDRECPGMTMHQALYHVITDLYGKSSGFRTTVIPLPAPPEPPKKAAPKKPPTAFLPDAGQSVAVYDDPAAGTMALVLTGAPGALPSDFAATLELRSTGGLTIPLVNDGAMASGRKLSLTFPSAAALGIEVAGLTELRLAWGALKPAPGAPLRRLVYVEAPKPADQAKTMKAEPPARAVVTAGPDGSMSVQVDAAK
ncbi:hypothetical protein ACQ5SO_10525 [Rhodovulum sp. DZ06]|uniref:hypothetical protein n=1 Tax=Rhodovulum sp. DZ06 TaxID=3425126 RepID=UPI003D358963